MDITLEEDKEWYRRYRYDIPVFHLNGDYLMKHHVKEDLLLQKLNEWEKSHPA